MDTLTQVVLGGAVGAAGFSQRLGRKAIAIGALGGLLPDLDFVISWNDAWAYLVHHRGFSHSLFVLGAVAPVLAWLGHRWSKGTGSYWTWLNLSLWALYTHVLLDACTTYGTQLLWPLSNHRFSIDAVSIIDPLYTVPLIVAVVLSCLPRVSLHFSARFALVMLLLTTGYLGLGYIQSRRAIGLAEAELASKGFGSVETRAMPTLFNIWVWRVVGRDAERNLQIGYVSTWSPRPIDFVSVEWPQHPLPLKVMSLETGQTFAWFAMDLVSVRLEQQTVVMTDQRYGMITQPSGGSPFRMRWKFDEEGRLLEFSRAPGRMDLDVNEELRALWNLLTGKID